MLTGSALQSIRRIWKTSRCTTSPHLRKPASASQPLLELSRVTGLTQSPLLLLPACSPAMTTTRSIQTASPFTVSVFPGHRAKRGHQRLNYPPRRVTTVGTGEIYRHYGIDKNKGAVIVVRPDGCKFASRSTAQTESAGILAYRTRTAAFPWQMLERSAISTTLLPWTPISANVSLGLLTL